MGKGSISLVSCLLQSMLKGNKDFCKNNLVNYLALKFYILSIKEITGNWSSELRNGPLLFVTLECILTGAYCSFSCTI